RIGNRENRQSGNRNRENRQSAIGRSGLDCRCVQSTMFVDCRFRAMADHRLSIATITDPRSSIADNAVHFTTLTSPLNVSNLSDASEDDDEREDEVLPTRPETLERRIERIVSGRSLSNCPLKVWNCTSALAVSATLARMDPLNVCALRLGDEPAPARSTSTLALKV